MKRKLPNIIFILAVVVIMTAVWALVACTRPSGAAAATVYPNSEFTQQELQVGGRTVTCVVWHHGVGNSSVGGIDCDWGR